MKSLRGVFGFEDFVGLSGGDGILGEMGSQTALACFFMGYAWGNVTFNVFTTHDDNLNMKTYSINMKMFNVVFLWTVSSQA